MKEPRLWPTPRASAAMAEKIENIQKRGTQRGKLEESVAMWPTPSAGMHKQDVNDKGRYARDIQEKGYQVMLPAAVKIRGKDGGTLNPNWVEWLMAFPTGWTDLKD